MLAKVQMYIMLLLTYNVAVSPLRVSLNTTTRRRYYDKVDREASHEHELLINGIQVSDSRSAVYHAIL